MDLCEGVEAEIGQARKICQDIVYIFLFLYSHDQTQFYIHKLEYASDPVHYEMTTQFGNASNLIYELHP